MKRNNSERNWEFAFQMVSKDRTLWNLIQFKDLRNNQPKFILKKGWLSDLETLEVRGRVNREQHTQKEFRNRIETPNIENQITTELNTTALILRQEDRTNIELIKIMSEQKITLPSLRDQDWEKVKVETENVNNVFQHVPMDNITELNELIYT